jgi:hypothetical protein
MPTSKPFLLAAAACLLWVANAAAQTVPAPKLTHVSPTGGQVGSTFELIVTGTDLDKAEGLFFSFPGATVESLGIIEPVVPVDPKKKAAQPKKDPNQPIRHKFKVTLPHQIPLGVQDVRVITAGGVSNPRAFVVSDMKEVVEQEPNDDVDKAQKVAINNSISGIIANPVDVDFYQFTGKKGQRVLLSCLTSSIDSKLPVQVEVFTSRDKLLGANRGYQNNDALVDVTLPENGTYFARVSCFTYTQGGPDYFYRLTISTGPWIDAVVPSAVEPGKPAQITLYGRNLRNGTADPGTLVEGKMLEKTSFDFLSPGGTRDRQQLFYNGLIMPNASGLDGFEIRTIHGGLSSNPYLLTFAPGPVVVDNEKNYTPDTAQTVKVPGAVSGRILKKGERHYYAFAAEAGQVLNFDLLSDRAGAPTDLNYEIFSLKPSPTILPGKGGKGAAGLITKQEDTPDSFGNQFPNATSDPASFRFVAPADGTYQVLVSSLEASFQYGPRHVYALSIAGDEPDFRLVAMPATNQSSEAVTLGQGGRQAFSLFVWRYGGFNGDVTLTGENLPSGVAMLPQVIAGNQKQAAFVISADVDAPHAVSDIKVVGSATIHGRKVMREVRGATITWGVLPQQLNVPMIARLDRQMVLAVRSRPAFHVQPEKSRIKILQGDKLTVLVKVDFAEYKGNVTLSALALPTGMTMQPINVTPDKNTVQVNIDSKPAVLPGNYTIVLRGQTLDPKGKPPAKPGITTNVIEAAPPINVVIVPRQLAKLTVPSNLKAVIGQDAELVVRLARQFNYEGSFKVEVVMPPNAKGITVEPVLLKEGQNEAKLIVRADEDAAVGMSLKLIVRATAMFNDTIPVVQEAVVSLAIAK